jgi:hypothetical protein
MDGPKKVPLKSFIQAVESGDLELKNPFEMDLERLALSDIMFEAFCNRRSVEEAMHATEEQIVQQFQTGNMVPQ